MPSITITMDAAQVQRVLVAFGRFWGKQNPDGTPRPATAAEVKAHLVGLLRTVVLGQESVMREDQVSVSDLVVT